MRCALHTAMTSRSIAAASASWRTRRSLIEALAAEAGVEEAGGVRADVGTALGWLGAAFALAAERSSFQRGASHAAHVVADNGLLSVHRVHVRKPPARFEAGGGGGGGTVRCGGCAARCGGCGCCVGGAAAPTGAEERRRSTSSRFSLRSVYEIPR